MNGRPDLKVWDPIVRTIHWLLVASAIVAWNVTAGLVHEIAGYLVLALMPFRVLWGFVGPEYARFKNFVRPGNEVWQYAKALLVRRERRHLGHNPLGGWMILALLGTGLATAISGWLYTTDAFWGVEWVENVHAFFAYVMLALAALHVAGVLFTSIRQRENLIAAMLHGKKRST